jgi:asparagine synthase (glutamine-hydrolysing)
MCGICGIYEPGSTVDASAIGAMAASMRHRGPDDQGVYTGRGIGLGHRRLSIIDLASGHQPLSNEDETVWIAFNGEIYNFEELNRQFLSSGHQFRSRSDTETIVHLYEELGEACFAQLRGMFAIALWDGRRQKLILARDRLGKKPLFYSWNGRRLVFGSEIKSIQAAGEFDDETDIEALSDYFSFGYVPAPKTIYRSVRKLRPAHYLVVENGAIRESEYWDISFARTQPLSEAEWCERFIAEYRESVRIRLISDVPLGAFLSGGVDSSSVVAMMNEIQRPVTTCSIGFAEHDYDEAAAARSFASSLGANHFEHTVAPNAIELLPKLAWHYDEPFADSSAVPTYYVSQVAREHVTVALSGDGGDENFAGYRRYKLTSREHQLRQHVPAAIRRPVFGWLGEHYPKLGWAPRVFRGKSTFQSLARDLITGYFHGVACYCPPELKNSLFHPDLVSSLSGYDSADVLRYHYDRCDSPDPLSRIQYVDMKTYLVDDILTKVDRASMANSLEVRSPLLDHKLMELIAQMPSNLKLRNGQGKYIFKKALEGIVPRSTLYRPKKGFAVPVAEWFRGELADFAYDALFSRDHQLLNRKFLSACWFEHQRGRRDWSPLLWSVLMFRTWESTCLRQGVYATA